MGDGGISESHAQRRRPTRHRRDCARCAVHHHAAREFVDAAPGRARRAGGDRLHRHVRHEVLQLGLQPFAAAADGNGARDTEGTTGGRVGTGVVDDVLGGAYA